MFLFKFTKVYSFSSGRCNRLTQKRNSGSITEGNLYVAMGALLKLGLRMYPLNLIQVILAEEMAGRS
jgi:hypothetical protein